MRVSDPKGGVEVMSRKIAIVGAGAVGGYAGAHMVHAGEDVTFIDPWPAHVDHMRKHGLRVTHASHWSRARPRGRSSRAHSSGDRVSQQRIARSIWTFRLRV